MNKIEGVMYFVLSTGHINVRRTEAKEEVIQG